MNPLVSNRIYGRNLPTISFGEVGKCLDPKISKNFFSESIGKIKRT